MGYVISLKKDIELDTVSEETIVHLLLTEKGSVPTCFLLKFLRAAYCYNVEKLGYVIYVLQAYFHR